MALQQQQQQQSSTSTTLKGGRLLDEGHGPSPVFSMATAWPLGGALVAGRQLWLKLTRAAVLRLESAPNLDLPTSMIAKRAQDTKCACRPSPTKEKKAKTN